MMARTPQSRGKCQYCGEETAKSGMSRHLAKCEERAKAIQTANAGNQPEETLWHLRVQDAYAKDFWLDLEMRGPATLQKLDAYLRAIWLECCGHLSKFTVGGWGGYDVGKARKADDVFSKVSDLIHLYDFGTTSETKIHVVGLRKGKALTKHAIVLMARNNMPQPPVEIAANLRLTFAWNVSSKEIWMKIHTCAKNMPKIIPT
jgi:hypothetical protein